MTRPTLAALAALALSACATARAPAAPPRCAAPSYLPTTATHSTSTRAPSASAVAPKAERAG